MNKEQQKRVAAIHDLSGFGKCSLTVALPILSAAGIETSALPTAILSTHTGGILGYTYRDLTEDMRPFMKHWKELDIRFDAVYSGFLGSFEQLDIVKEFFSLFKREDNLILVDPVMGDNGELYKIFTPKFAKGMRSLCERADIIVPNLTEAALLLGEPYQAGPYTKAYIDGILHKLSQLGPKQVVLTGVYFDEKELGAATFDMERNATEYRGIAGAVRPGISGAAQRPLCCDFPQPGQGLSGDSRRHRRGRQERGSGLHRGLLYVVPSLRVQLQYLL